eukprot:COSAG01_NODE_1775_length_9260_cov_58.468784_4_plen_214_part_00
MFAINPIIFTRTRSVEHAHTSVEGGESDRGHHDGQPGRAEEPGQPRAQPHRRAPAPRPAPQQHLPPSSMPPRHTHRTAHRTAPRAATAGWCHTSAVSVTWPPWARRGTPRAEGTAPTACAKACAGGAGYATAGYCSGGGGGGGCRTLTPQSSAATATLMALPGVPPVAAPPPPPPPLPPMIQASSCAAMVPWSRAWGGHGPGHSDVGAPPTAA